MNELHPHWHSTADESADKQAGPSKIRVDAEERMPPTGSKSASRLPAAIVGILIVFAIGTAVVQNWASLSGQAAGNPSGGAAGGSSIPADAIVIHVATGGLVPQKVTAKPGQKIAWINDQKVPQIFQSATLKDGSGRLLYTAPIFPGGSYVFAIPLDAEKIAHEYKSATAASFTGTIDLSDPTQPAAAGSDAPLFGGLDGVGLPTGQGRVETGAPDTGAAFPPPVTVAATNTPATTSAPTPQAATQQPPAFPPALPSSPASAAQQPSSLGNAPAPTVPAPSAGATNAAALPFNPFTVGRAPQQGAPSSAGNVLAQASGTKIGKTALHVAAPSQPKSGPEVWIVVALSLGALWWVTRKKLIAYRL